MFFEGVFQHLSLITQLFSVVYAQRCSAHASKLIKLALNVTLRLSSENTLRPKKCTTSVFLSHVGVLFHENH